MTSDEQQVTSAVTKTKKLWFAFMLVMIAVCLFFQLPAWYLVPIAVVSYFGSVTLTIIAKTRSLEEDEVENPLLLKLHQDLEAGLVEPGSEEMFERMKECGIVDVYAVGDVSEEIVGVYNGHKMYEWVEIQDPESKEMFKFYYHGPGQYAGDGTPVLPEKDGVLYAHVEGVTYYREE